MAKKQKKLPWWTVFGYCEESGMGVTTSVQAKDDYAAISKLCEHLGDGSIEDLWIVDVIKGKHASAWENDSGKIATAKDILGE